MENMQILKSLIENPVALSVRQPWAWLIANEYKDIENRTWPTDIRGWVFIHASQTFDNHAFNYIPTYIISQIPPKKCYYWLGGLVGIMKISDCVKKSKSIWFFGPYGFVIEEARPIDFILCKGTLGFFKPEINWERIR